MVTLNWSCRYFLKQLFHHDVKLIIWIIDSLFVETDTTHFKSVVQSFTGQKCSDSNIVPLLDSSTSKNEVFLAEPPVKEIQDEKSELDFLELDHEPILAREEKESSVTDFLVECMGFKT